MGTEVGAPGRVAGRARELELLAQALDEAADGVPRAVVVRGEAGVGKTRLVSAVCDRARERDLTVLWGTCVRFGAIESTFLPWVMAVERWLASAAEADRQRVLAEVPQAAQLLPSLGGGGSGTDAVRLMRVLKALVASIGARGPTVLVMDDVQWADPASRDVLTYLLAGLASERLLVLATVRDEGVPAEDPVHGWLADLRRLPSVAELPLARLSLEETAEQVAVPARAAPASSLVEDVHARTGGNPYLVELLCHDVDAGAQALPEGVPEDLSRALLEVWYRLSEPAREAARILAVAGRPSPLAGLEQACAAIAGTAAASVRAAVAEAIGAGVMVRPDAGQVWFRHPLLAEVLPTTYLPGEAAPIHAAWADQLAQGTAEGVEEVRRLGDLALHREGAGQLDGCVVASLAAADAAHQLRMWREEEAHLERALRLWPDADPQLTAGHDLATLHERAARAGEYIGHTDDAVRHLDQALRVAEAAGDVLRASSLPHRRPGRTAGPTRTPPHRWRRPEPSWRSPRRSPTVASTPKRGPTSPTSSPGPRTRRRPSPRRSVRWRWRRDPGHPERCASPMAPSSGLGPAAATTPMRGMPANACAGRGLSGDRELISVALQHTGQLLRGDRAGCGSWPTRAPSSSGFAAGQWHAR